MLYGRPLPPEFFACAGADFPAGTDLLIVAGTSLTVHPAAGLVRRTAPSQPRLVVNNERVGVGLGLRYDDGDSDRDSGRDGGRDTGRRCGVSRCTSKLIPVFRAVPVPGLGRASSGPGQG